MRDRNGYIVDEYNDEATPQAESAPVPSKKAPQEINLIKRVEQE